ncbi:MAG: insulinase family protein [Candidatus Kapabacteria bacterium]|nr:insulinase family protein [Ignavibacteriota bacterium]MCW5885454.1 insulinase family protein [Candidatus Kapabacteria bacterium]
MYKLFLFITLLFVNISLLAKDFNPDLMPEPLEETGFKFPDYIVNTLENGLKVYVIQDKEQPVVSFRLMIFGGASVEGTKAGVAELTTSMLTKGTQKRSAGDIAEIIDGMGATLSSSATSDYWTIYAEGLKKYESTLLDVMADILLNPKFDTQEFLKIQQQTLAGLQFEKSNSGELAQALSRIAVYGKDHPYAQRKTEQSVNSINVNDLKEFHKLWTKPNNASIAVVGDVDPDIIVKKLEELFKNWSKSEVPAINVPEATPMPKGIYFVNRSGSAQSSIIITTNTIPYNHIDLERLKLASALIGGSNGRLYQTLREKYSFTYSPYGFHTSTKFANRFAAVAEVAKAKTDSSIALVISELNDIISNSPKSEELERVRTSLLGNYNMSFENSLFIASLIQNEEFYGKRINEIKTYASKIKSLTPNDITTAVKSYINPDNAQIIVVGEPAIASELEKYGIVFKYDLDLNALSGKDGKTEKISLSAKDLINRYEKAIGGKSNVEKITSLNVISEAELNVGGQMLQGQVLSQKKLPNKLYNVSDFNVFKSQVWVDGENAWSSQGDQESIIQEGDDKKRMFFDAEIFPILTLQKYSYKLEVQGKQGNSILLMATSETGSDKTYYFNADNYLLEKEEFLIDSGIGMSEIWSISYSDYQDFQGIKLPTVQVTRTPNFVITMKSNYEINPEIEEEVFKPQK